MNIADPRPAVSATLPKSDASDVHGSLDDRNEVFEAFSVYRDYLVHEDMLINQRLQRMLIIQGFLFAAEATLLSKLPDTLNSVQTTTSADSPLAHTFHMQILFAFLMAITGLLAARFVYVALKSATEALYELRSTWEKHWGSRADQYLLPKLTGGGSPYANKYGHKHVTHLALWFGVVWTILMPILGLLAYKTAYRLSM